MFAFVKLIKFKKYLILKIMYKFVGLRTRVKIALFMVVLALVLATVFLYYIQISGGGNALTEAIEGGESTLTAIGRSHESLTNFVHEEEELTGELLEAARASQDNAKAKLASARHTEDDYVLKMVENYGILFDSSQVMIQGVDNLLAISEDLEKTLNSYWKGEYEVAAEEASSSLQTLTPLVGHFEKWNQSLEDLIYGFIASGHRNRAKQAIVQYRDEMRIYNEYILLLESIINGVDYLETMDSIDELFDQMQHELASQDYSNARTLLEEIFEQLRLLKDPQYQDAASTASQLDPNLLEGAAFSTAQDVKNRLKDLKGIQEFENYLEAVAEFIEASRLFEEGNLEAAEGAINQGLLLLEGGEALTDMEVQKFHTALKEDFSSLRARWQLRDQPEPG